MRKIIPLFLILLLQFTSQSQDVTSYITSGIEAHDKGDYDLAIEKFDAALKIDPQHYHAMYEKSFSLMAQKKYPEAEKILKIIIKKCKDDPDTKKMAYINYGTIMDYTGDKKGAIKIYDQGINEFSDSYLLYYNKAITLIGLKETAAAIEQLQAALKCNPLHASSHNALARLQLSSSKVKGLLSLFTFLAIEPNTTRAKQNLELMNAQFSRGISKGENNNVTISIDAALLDPKKSKTDDNFSMTEIMLSMLEVTTNVEDSLGLKTPAEKLGYKFDLLFGSQEETDNDKGFFHRFYLPFFREMKLLNWTTTASYIALSSDQSEDIQNWLTTNNEKVTGFYFWLKNYQWITPVK